MTQRSRISIRKEDRIWQLRCQGYDYDSIARIVNTSASLTGVIRRVRRRPEPGVHNRKCGFLDDSQIDTIRMRRSQGESLRSLSKVYGISVSAICNICTGRSYVEPEYPNGYKFNFTNRLVQG